MDEDALSTTVDLFFFQAEDGIRDLYVTGVQTCALPILREMSSRSSTSRDICATCRSIVSSNELARAGSTGPLRSMCSAVRIGASGLRSSRSEERRVGKEGRCRERQVH